MADNGFTHTSYQQFLDAGKIMGTHCKQCGAAHLPPRPICPVCRSSQVEWVELEGKGKLVAFSIIYTAPTAMMKAGYNRSNPYCAGIVRLESGPSISAQILGVDVSQPETITLGAPVAATFLERGEGDAKTNYLGFQIIQG